MKTFFTNQVLILLSKSSILVGGQAVIEGVMMRVPGYISTAVRDPHGDIITKRQAFNTLVKKHKYLDLSGLEVQEPVSSLHINEMYPRKVQETQVFCRGI